MKRSQRDTCKLVESAGLEVLSVCQSGGSHIKIRARRSDGTEANFTFPLTTSDERSAKNRLADLRRFADGRWSPVLERKQHEHTRTPAML